MSDTLETGRALAETLNPGMEATLEARYGHLVPGMAEGAIDFSAENEQTEEAKDAP